VQQVEQDGARNTAHRSALVGMARDLAPTDLNAARTGIGAELRKIHSDPLREEIPNAMAKLIKQRKWKRAPAVRTPTTDSVALPWRAPEIAALEDDRRVTDCQLHRTPRPGWPLRPTALVSFGIPQSKAGGPIGPLIPLAPLGRRSTSRTPSARGTKGVGADVPCQPLC
jgi:hypothetical protein